MKYLDENSFRMWIEIGAILMTEDVKSDMAEIINAEDRKDRMLICLRILPDAKSAMMVNVAVEGLLSAVHDLEDLS